MCNYKYETIFSKYSQSVRSSQSQVISPTHITARGPAQQKEGIILIKHPIGPLYWMASRGCCSQQQCVKRQREYTLVITAQTGGER